jgi:2-C-methyl-D-erythritol 2,4-cyclodiphosphate synthase
MFRIGHSYDIHRLEEGYDLWIGGINIPFEKGLVGHSDADVLLHAIAESMIGALGLNDIGTHFPDTDPQYKGIDSKILLSESFKLVKREGYVINNLDATIFAEQPKMRPHIENMKSVVAEILETDTKNVNIKATRGEKLGYIGRSEGISAECVVLLIKKDV